MPMAEAAKIAAVAVTVRERPMPLLMRCVLMCQEWAIVACHRRDSGRYPRSQPSHRGVVHDKVLHRLCLPEAGALYACCRSGPAMLARNHTPASNGRSTHRCGGTAPTAHPARSEG